MAAPRQLTPKGPTAYPDGGDFDRAALLARLFALPLPPYPTSDKGGHRAYPVHTPLGRIMRLRTIRASDLSIQSGVYVRTMTEYLAGRKAIPPRHRIALARALDVDPRIF